MQKSKGYGLGRGEGIGDRVNGGGEGIGDRCIGR